MKFGVSAYAWSAPFRDGDLGLFAKVAAMGSDVLEVPVWGPDQFDVERAAELARQYGVECVVGADMTDEADLAHPDAGVRRAGVERLKYCIDVAERLGARMVAGPFAVASYRFWWPDAERRLADRRYAADGLREAAGYAAGKGIKLALELLNRYETPFCTQVADGVALCEAVADPAFGLLLDTFHMNVEEKDMGEAIERAGAHLYYLHVCENDRGAPGSGHIPWDEIATALRRTRFDGYVVVESFVFEPEFGAATRAWRPCAPDMDALARDGIAFARRLLAQPHTRPSALADGSEPKGGAVA
ncbi:MAG: sugar phosphate isomerase/epimerase family protein [Anaerolineae bacterium]